MMLSRLLIGLGLVNFVNSVSGFRAVFIVAPPAGLDDQNDVVNSKLSTYLRHTIQDFTVPAADTTASLRGMLTGKLQLDPDHTFQMPSTNIHSVFKNANITTAHYGYWNYSTSPNTDAYQIIPENPIDTIQAAIKFANANAKNNYMMTVAMPFVDVRFLPLSNPLMGIEGVSAKSKVCREHLRTTSNPVLHKTCPRQVYLASLKLKDQLLTNLVKVLAAQQAYVFITAVHGGLSPHTHSDSLVRTRARGAHNSLYHGGIAARVFTNVVFHQKSGNGVDILSSLAALAQINTNSLQLDGINLFNAQALRSKALQWITKQAAEGPCMHVSPGMAKQVEHEGKKYKILWDKYRPMEIYPWGRFEAQQAKIPIATPPLPDFSLAGCALTPATGVKINLKNALAPQLVILKIKDDFGYDPSKPQRSKGKNYPFMPNMNRRSQNALYFTMAQVTAPFCSPSRASFLTAKYPSHRQLMVYKIFGESSSSKETLGLTAFLGQGQNMSFLPKFLHDQGNIYSALVGKEHLANPGTVGPGHFGFDIAYCYDCNVAPQYRINNFDVYFPSYATSMIVNKSIELIKKVVIGERKRMFLMMALQTLHSPINTRPGQAAALGHKNSDNPYIISSAPLLADNEVPLQRAAALVTELDLQEERLYTFLEQNNLISVTVIVDIPDNGPEADPVYFGSVLETDYRGKKRTLGGGVHVPMSISWNGHLTGVTDLPVNGVDMFGLVAGFFGIKHNMAFDYNIFDGKLNLYDCLTTNSCDGFRNRVQLWESRMDQISNDCFGASKRFSVMQGQYKLHAGCLGTTVPQNCAFNNVRLHNVYTDPAELQDLSAELPDVVKSLTSELRSWPNYGASTWSEATSLPSENSKKFFIGFKCQ